MIRPEQLEALSEDGIEVVINVLPDDSEYAVAGEKAIVRRQGIEYWHLPVDFSAPTLDGYIRFRDKLDQIGDKKTIIHCGANYRASAFYSRYAIESGRWQTEEADRFMLSIWNPAEYPGWPEWLEAVGRRLK